MNQELYEYLSDEYRKYAKEEEELIKEKADLEREKRKFEENLNFHYEDEKKRQLFSPLILKNAGLSKEISGNEFDSSDSGKKLFFYNNKIKEIQKKKSQMKAYMHSFNQISIKFDQLDEKEDIPFLPEFYKIVDITQKLVPNFKIKYQKNSSYTDLTMKYYFVQGWMELFSYVSEHFMISDSSIRMMVERKRIAIEVKFNSKVSLNNKLKKELQSVLKKDFYIQSWKNRHFVVNIILKQK